jgi:YD repeat-containing protein
MNYSLIYNVIFVCLLASCSDYKKDTQQTIPVQSTSCLIASQTTKELVSASQPSTLDPETVTINGESFQVTTTKKSVYTYDTQGRILTEYNQFAGNKADSVLYQYSPGAVMIRTVKLTTPKTVDTLVVALNNQGYAEKKPFGYHVTYDKNGYLISQTDEYGTTAKINNGNVIEEEILGQDATPNHTYRFEYDLNKSGLLSTRSFYGKASRNLPVKYTIQQNGPFGTYPDVYQATYTYVFNENGFVKRQIFQGKNGEHPYLYGGGGDFIKVLDFTYICP